MHGTLPEQTSASLQQFYDEHAKSGESYGDPLVEDCFTEHAFEGIRGGAVADIGCGVGRAVEMLFALGARSYVGYDFAREALARARTLYSHAEFRFGDVLQEKGLGEGSFDGFLCNCLLMHIPRPKAPVAFRAMRHILRTGAVGVVCTPHSFERAEVRNTAGMYLTLYSTEEVGQIAEANGFSVRFSTLSEGNYCPLAKLALEAV